MFQYDTKHSNLFLSHYVNQLLNAVGDDSIVRGLEVSPEVNSSKTGINFKISPGALVQDLTYFEFQKETIVPVEDIADLSDFYIILCTSWRYLETVYDNPLKFEATLYNPRTKRTLSPWNPAVNRIILGVYSFNSDDGLITEVVKEESTLFFGDSNAVKNGTFDNGSTDFWTAVNSIIGISPGSDGILDTKYVVVTPKSGSYQGIAQVMPTKPNVTYEVSFYVRSDESVPFIAKVLDKSSIYDSGADVVEFYESTSTKRWSLHNFRFTAFSNQSTLLLLKNSESLDNNIYFDHISSYEHTPTRNNSSLHRVAMIDGGLVPTTEDLIPEKKVYDYVYSWTFSSREGVHEFHVDSTSSPLKNPTHGFYFVFFNGISVSEKDYHIDWKNNKIQFNSIVDVPGKEISILFVRNPIGSNYSWKIPVEDGVATYSPTLAQENFPDPSLGEYIVFMNSTKMHESEYSIDSTRNVFQLNSAAENGKEIEIYFITDPIVYKLWTFNSVEGRNTYSLEPGSSPFLNESKGKYAVFLNGSKLASEDCIINPETGSLAIGIIPEESGLPLEVYYFGNSEEVDETPQDLNSDEYRWTFNLENGKYSYVLDEAVDPFRNNGTGYYLTFIGGEKVNSNLYDISPAARKISFAIEAPVASGSVAETYFIKKPASQYNNWTFTATVSGAHDFIVPTYESSLRSPDEGLYMIFLNGSKLSKDQYRVLYSENRIRLDNSIEVSQGDVIQAIFVTNPVTYGFWAFDSVENIKTYTPKSSEDNFAELGDGEFLLFFGGRKMSPEEFKINKLRNNISFNKPPRESGIKCELYFLGKE